MKFSAAILEQLNQPLAVREDVTIPELLRGQVLVQVKFSGLCRSQLMEANGGRGEDRYLPHMLGHEATGIVMDTGPGVEKVVVGDAVVLGWLKGSGLEAEPIRYQRADGTNVNAGAVATFCEYAVVSENRCYVYPDGVPMDLAVFFGCAIPTGAGIVLHEIDASPDSTIAVLGLGGVGLSALMATALGKFSAIIAMDTENEKLELARALGATHCVNVGETNPVSAIADITAGRGVDYCIEAAGAVATIEQAFSCVRPKGGLCVFASHPNANEVIRLDPFDFHQGRCIRGTWGGRCNPDVDLPRFAELYRSGNLPLEKLAGPQYRLDQINDAMDDLAQRRVARPLLRLQSVEQIP